MCFFASPEDPCRAQFSGQILIIFRVCAVLYDNSSCLIGSVSCVDPPGGAEHHGRSHSEPVLCVWGGCRELLSQRECEILCVSAGALQHPSPPR